TSISAMRNFTSNASHQLRTPLAVMRTQAEIARRAKSDVDREKALTQVDDAIKDSEKMISRLMVLARIDSGALENLPNLNCDIAETCRLVCADIISHQKLGNIDLGYEGIDHLLIKGDPVLYREMLRNLVENAVKYGGEDIHITVSCRNIDDQCHIDIEDSGIGMTAQQKVDLMQRFSSGEYSKNGSGLGLPIARDIAHLFGGVMELKNRKDGSGLVVSLLFPQLLEA
ncbi:MAG: HAMP domain-containing sensor histidine kinase, partial [Lentilitoribacter sp.]